MPHIEIMFYERANSLCYKLTNWWNIWIIFWKSISILKILPEYWVSFGPQILAIKWVFDSLTNSIKVLIRRKTHKNQMRVASDSTQWEEFNHATPIELRPPVHKPRPLFNKALKWPLGDAIWVSLNSAPWVLSNI
jgi:hypothetical protein